LNWYRIAAGNRDDYLRGLGVVEDVIAYINSVTDQRLAQLLANEARKNSQINISQLQEIVTSQPQQKEQWYEPFLQQEMRHYNDGRYESPEFQKWVHTQIRKLLALGTATRTPELEDTLRGIVLRTNRIGQKLSEIFDWYSRSEQDFDIASYSFDQAAVASDEWHKTVAGMGQGKIYEPTKPELIVWGPDWIDPRTKKQIPQWQGWTIQKIMSENDLKTEGNRMSHCVGSYCDDMTSGDSVFYSLRDPQNIPHVTIEAENTGQYIKQIKGNSNKEPDKEYKAMIKNWTLGYQSGEAEIGLKGIEDDGDFFDEMYQSKYPDGLADAVNGILGNNEYGFDMTNKAAEQLENIYQHSLDVVTNASDSHYGYTGRDGNLSDILVDIATRAGDDHIEELIDIMQKAEDKEKHDPMNYYESYEPSPDRADFETDEEFAEAEAEYERNESEAIDDLYAHSLPWGWNIDIYKELRRYLEKYKGITLDEWWKKRAQEKAKKERAQKNLEEWKKKKERKQNQQGIV
jgi:PcfJ-like protein